MKRWLEHSNRLIDWKNLLHWNERLTLKLNNVSNDCNKLLARKKSNLKQNDELDWMPNIEQDKNNHEHNVISKVRSLISSFDLD